MKSLVVYKVDKDFTGLQELSESYLHNNFMFKPCQGAQASSVGLEYTVFDELRSYQNGLYFFNVRTQKKSPHKATINSLVDEKVRDITNTQLRKVPKQELQNIKDDAYMEVLLKTVPDAPKDFTVFFDSISSLLFVEAPNYNKGRDIIGILADACGGTLPLVSVTPPDDIETKLKLMVMGDTQDPFTLGSYVGMEDEQGRKITFANGSLYQSNAEYHLDTGATVDTVELDFDGSFVFRLKTTLEYPSIKFSKEFANSAEGDEKATMLMKSNEIIKMIRDMDGVLV